MFILARALTYAVFFVGFFLVFLPAQVVLRTTGILRPAAIGAWQVAGLLSGVVGAALVLACILTFVFVGEGTQAPFDPPHRLVLRGPYRFVRNPMYIGAGLALIGAALFYRSTPQFAYAWAFLLLTHVLVIWYEEPALRRTFNGEYEAYCARTGRWWPKRTGLFTIGS